MKKQLIFIMTDTTRFDMLGCYGNKDMITPNLDALAEEGVRFELAYSCQPVCGPARSAIFTGQYPHSNGSFTNSYPLGANVKTVGQRLRDNGFKTCYIGKWHLDGGDYFGLGECPDGWDKDYWYDMKCYLEELTEEERVKSRNPDTNKEPISEEFTYAHRVVKRALDYIEKNKDEDFFLVVSLDEPHDPYLCPEPFASMYKDYEFPKTKNMWDTLEGKPFYQKLWAGKHLSENIDELVIKADYFFGCNSFADYEIGKVIDKAKELTPNAGIIYTSDHGDALHAHRLWAKGACLYDEIARIPLIAYGMGGKGVCPHPVSHISLTPTILEYMGVSVPKLMEGESILPSMKDPSHKCYDNAFVEFTRYEVDHDGFGGVQMMRAVTDGRYKLCIHLLDPVDEFYDTKVDPDELHNLIEDERYTEERNRLHDALIDNMDKTRDPFRGYQWECRYWRKDAKTPTYENHLCTRQRENEEYEPRQLDYATGLEMVSATRIKKLID